MSAFEMIFESLWQIVTHDLNLLEVAVRSSLPHILAYITQVLVDPVCIFSVIWSHSVWTKCPGARNEGCTSQRSLTREYYSFFPLIITGTDSSRAPIYIFKLYSMITRCCIHLKNRGLRESMVNTEQHMSFWYSLLWKI